MGVFAIKRTATGCRFDLKADNGQIVASSEVYTSEAACRKGIRSFQNCCVGPVEDLTAPAPPVAGPKYQLYRDKAGQYRFRLRARNGKIIAFSEGYTTKNACCRGIESVKLNAPGAALEE